MKHINRLDPVFDGVRGRVLAVLCEADDRLSGGQVASLADAARSTTHTVLGELVDAGIVRRRDHPSVTMFDLHDNAVARSIETLHEESTDGEKSAAVSIIRHVLPKWARQRHELSTLS